MKKGTMIKIAITVLVLLSMLFLILPEFLYNTNEVVSNSKEVVSDKKEIPQPNANELTVDEARKLVIEKWGDCVPSRCSKVIVSVEKKEDIWYVTAIYDGLKDDSVQAEQKVAPATFSNGAWILGNPSMSHRCQKKRGHQDFSNELCL